MAILKSSLLLFDPDPGSFFFYPINGIDRIYKTKQHNSNSSSWCNCNISSCISISNSILVIVVIVAELAVILIAVVKITVVIITVAVVVVLGSGGSGFTNSISSIRGNSGWNSPSHLINCYSAEFV